MTHKMSQDQAESSCGAPAWNGHRSLRRSFSAPSPLGHFDPEEQSSQKLQKDVPPSPHLVVSQLQSEMCSVKWIVDFFAKRAFGERCPPQLALELEKLSQQGDHQQNQNNNNNHNNNNNTVIRESSLQSLDLEDDSPELDEKKLNNLDSESSLEQDLGEQEVDNFQRSSFRETSLDWNPSLDQEEAEQEKERDSFGREQPKKTACHEQNNRKGQNLGYHNSQLEQLEQRGKQQNQQQAWTEIPSKMQQQPAPALEKKMEYKQCTDKSLHSEGQSLGSLGTTKHALGSPKQHNNNSTLGIGTKNRAAWEILIDTGAALSVAPVSFAPEIELSPLNCTLELRNVEGKAFRALGRRTIQLVCGQLCFSVNFVIAEVEQALIGMDIFLGQHLSLERSKSNEHYLVNSAGARTQLKLKGQLLYLEACSGEPGLSTCLGSSLPKPSGILLEDEDSDQEEASGDELAFTDLRTQQSKNTANLGTTALPKQGARKHKKPSARTASLEPIQEESLEQEGQHTASAHLRTAWEKTSLMEQLELDAEKETNNLQEQEKREISLRILVTLSLLNQWQMTKAKASTACSEGSLQEHLQELGLEQHRIDHNIFFGDKLVVMISNLHMLIGGEKSMQELLLNQLSAKLPLEQPEQLEEGTSISFLGRSLEYNSFMNMVQMQVPACFYVQLLQNHGLEGAEPLTSLEEELGQEAPRQSSRPLGAKRSKLYKQTVAELIWSTTCRPDLSFPIQQLQASLGNPTREDEQQLHRVLRYIKGTLDLSLNLRPKNKMTEEKAWTTDLLAFSATSWAEPFKTTSVAYLTLWGVPLVTSCRSKGAYNQTEAEVDSVNLALALALYTRNLLQQLRVDCLRELVNIQVKMCSLNVMLVTGRPLAMQLGISRRHKHIEIGSEKGQLKISRIHPEKNLAQSLTNNPTASIQHWLLPKLRLASKAVELWTLSTGLSFEQRSLSPSSSLMVGMLAVEAPKMAKPYPRELVSQKSVADSFHRNSFESLPTNLPSLSVEPRASLTLHRLSFQRDSFSSLTLQSLSIQEDILSSLILFSQSLQRASLPSLTSKSLSLPKDLTPA